jgi:predicted dehydrogenase
MVDQTSYEVGKGESPLKLGFIGCGGFSSSTLYPNIPLIPEIDLVATCDIIESKAKLNARKFGAKAWYTDYEKMIKEQQLDAVCIVGPPQMHFKIGLACLELGVHIYTEKPNARDVEGSRKLMETAKRKGKFGQIGFMWRHAKAHRIAKQLIESEEFGRPILFRGAYLTPGPTGSRPESHGDTLEWTYMLDQAVHIVDCMRFLMGHEVSKVNAMIEHRNDASGRDMALSFSVSLRFKNGATGNLSMSSFYPGFEKYVFVQGDRSQAVDVYNKEKIRHLKRGAWFLPPPPPETRGYEGLPPGLPTLEWNPGSFHWISPGYLDELKHFACSIIKNEQPSPSLEDSYQVMRVCKAIVESGKEDHPVYL